MPWDDADRCHQQTPNRQTDMNEAECKARRCSRKVLLVQRREALGTMGHARPRSTACRLGSRDEVSDRFRSVQPFRGG